MKLYITDLDGTLLDYKAAVPKLTAEILNRELKNGRMITYATARSIYSATPILNEINFRLPVITQNGAFIVDPVTRKQLVTHNFGEKEKLFLKEFFTDNKESLLVYSYINGAERVSWQESNKNAGVKRYIKQRSGDSRLRPCEDFESLFDGEVYYITLIEPKLSPAELDKFFDNKNGFARNYQEDTYDTDEYWYEIFRDDVSKANAVKQLKEMLGADEVICFGDNTNDISMFSAADRCYAVSNAKKELKQIATGIIRSNNQSGVPIFIANDNCTVWRKEKNDISFTDNEKFRQCILLSEKEIDSSGIGTLNEKQIHSALKSYFSETEYDKEIKIGNYYADLVTENGIYEIQTGNFKKLIPKLDVFLQYSHVTVVYPYHKTTRLSYFDKASGELLKSGRKVCHNDLTDFFIELYRIKQYLNNPNLTVCIANLAVENYRFCKPDMKRRKTDTKKCVPTDMMSLAFLDSKDDYRIFIPDGLPEIFTVKDFRAACRISQPEILIKILTYVGLVDYFGKNRNEIIYTLN